MAGSLGLILSLAAVSIPMSQTPPVVEGSAPGAVAGAGGAGVEGQGASKLDAAKFAALAARSIGPAIMSGRISDLAVNPAKHSEFYVAVASGNLWKTTNGGVTFQPIFDKYGSFSIGCVTLDPTNPSVVWVGTGENNSQRSVSWGDGIYVSRDGGKSFKNVGLAESEHIGMIRIDPRDPAVVYAAAQGPLWRSGGDRGLYKTTDGGGTWTRILHVSEETGINEVHMDPRNPDVLYASAYQRRRHVWTLVNGGPESAIYKSDDGGKHWRKLESGLPSGDKGRIGLAISPANPDMVYAIVEAAMGKGGIFRSTDRGETWEKRSSYMASSPQYYNELFPDPKNPDRVYSADTFLHMTDDGGTTWKNIQGKDVHVDSHALWIDPSDPDHLLLGNDGGLYESFDRTNWRHFENLPVMQFYRVAVDNSEPFYFVYGGTQDNNTLGGPSRTTDRVGITNEDWFVTTGGDGFEPAIDPEDPNIVYSQSQYCGLVRYDRRSGEEVDIKPREAPGEPPYVWNWDTPLLISPHNSKRLYLASRVLHRSDDRGDSWKVVSPDLTRKVDRNALPVMGVIQKPEAVAKHRSTSIYGNSIALTESPEVEGLIYVGTDDGLVQVTEDGGGTWRKIENFPVVPEMTYVSDLEASRHGADVVYAAFDNHKNGDFTPYVLRSDDRGRGWRSIAGDLPKNAPVYTIAEDHVNPDLLFVGTELGAYFTIDGGKHWLKFSGVPTIAVRDIDIQRRANDLVFATFGRGFYIVDDFSPLRAITPETFDQPAVMFPIRTAFSYIERSRLGGTSGRGWSGADHYAASNPPFGAVVTYFLKDKPLSRKERRLDEQKKDGWKYPPIDRLRAEDRELEPRVVLTIRDADGTVIRRIDAPREAGMQRVAWNLRYPKSTPVSLNAVERAPWETEVDGTLVPPGKYTAQLSTLIDGTITDLTTQQPFEVVDLELATFAAKDEARAAKFAFERRAAELQRVVEGAVRVSDEAQNRVAFLRRAATDTPGLDPGVFARLEALRQELLTLRTAMTGDSTLAQREEPAPTSILERVSVAVGGSLATTQPPTGIQREQYEQATAEFGKIWPRLRTLVDEDLVALEKAFEAGGAPWTPGRLPDWKAK